MATRLRTIYDAEIAPALSARFGYRNTMEIPKLEKIVLNMGVGEAIGNPKALDAAMADLTTISGQKPSVRGAKRSISNLIDVLLVLKVLDFPNENGVL